MDTQAICQVVAAGIWGLAGVCWAANALHGIRARRARAKVSEAFAAGEIAALTAFRNKLLDMAVDHVAQVTSVHKVAGTLGGVDGPQEAPCV